MLERPGQKSIVLILARELASKLATPAFVTDEHGELVYYNEAAEELLGRTLAETAALPARDWRALFAFERLDGGPLQLDELPGMIALQGRPAHDEVRVVVGDGVWRQIDVTALPLFAHAEELVGVLIVFWPSVTG